MSTFNHDFPFDLKATLGEYFDDKRHYALFDPKHDANAVYFSITHGWRIEITNVPVADDKFYMLLSRKKREF